MRRSLTGPLKAYRIIWCGEPVSELFVGQNSGKAKAAFARSVWTTGMTKNSDVWRNLRAIRCHDEAGVRAVEDWEDRGLYWRDTRRVKRLQAEVDAFNAAYPVGSPVQVVDCYEAKDWSDGRTTTSSPAWLSSPTTILVSLTGASGGFFMKYIKPLVAPPTTAP